MTTLDPIRGRTLSDDVEQRLLSYLRENRFAEGDALPGELELAERLAVSRNVVREALSRLRMLGLVRSKKRRGMIVGKPDIPGSLSRILDTAFLDDTRIRELRELRLVIEIGLAPFLFANRSESGLAELAAIVEKEERIASKRGASRKLDAEFHACLYRIAGNAMLEQFQTLLPSFFEHTDSRSFNPNRFSDPDIVTHRDLLHELRHGTSSGFACAMQKHLTPHLPCPQKKS